MPLFSRILGQLDDHLKGARRARLRARMTHVIAQDRCDRLAAVTGWAPPGGITGSTLPRGRAGNVIRRGGRDAPR